LVSILRRVAPTALRAEHQENATALQRVVDHMAKLFSRPWFIGAISIVIAGWIGFNLISATLGRHTLDPPPFAWLGEAISLTSLYMVILILTSQKREDQLAHHREMLILELAILSEQKIAKSFSFWRNPAVTILIFATVSTPKLKRWARPPTRNRC